MLSAMARVQRRNFHLPLPEGLHTSLRQEAAREGRPATDLAREAIEVLLRVRRRRALQDAIAAYAAGMAGTAADLDLELEAAAVERMLADKGGR